VLVHHSYRAWKQSASLITVLDAVSDFKCTYQREDRDLDIKHAKFLILMFKVKFIQDKEIMQRGYFVMYFVIKVL
jgi:hypothetical protein